MKKTSEFYKILYEREQLRNHYLRESLKYNPNRRNKMGGLDLTEIELHWNNRVLAAIL